MTSDTSMTTSPRWSGVCITRYGLTLDTSEATSCMCCQWHRLAIGAQIGSRHSLAKWLLHKKDCWCLRASHCLCGLMATFAHFTAADILTSAQHLPGPASISCELAPPLSPEHVFAINIRHVLQCYELLMDICYSLINCVYYLLLIWNKCVFCFICQSQRATITHWHLTKRLIAAHYSIECNRLPQ